MESIANQLADQRAHDLQREAARARLVRQLVRRRRELRQQ
jgi:hypothetical protein